MFLYDPYAQFPGTVCLLLLAGIGAAQSKNRPSAASRLQNYSNSDFGFSLNYPANLILNLGRISYKEASLLSFIPPCDSATVACLFYNGREYEGTNFGAAALSVNILGISGRSRPARRSTRVPFP